MQRRLYVVQRRPEPDFCGKLRGLQGDTNRQGRLIVLVVQACHRSDAVTARLEVLSDELEFVPSLGDGTDHSVHNGSRHARSDGDPARQGLQTGQLTLLGLTAASDQPLSRRKGPHGPDGSHGVGEQQAAVPRSELCLGTVSPCHFPCQQLP